MRVGIVGTGISGLAAGWLLRRAGHSVTLIERMPRLGLDAHSVDFRADWLETNPISSIPPLRADVPPRMFNMALWPNLFRLYKKAGVEVESVDGSKLFGDYQGKVRLRLKDSFAQHAWTTLFNRNAWGIWRDIRRMKSECPQDLRDPELSTVDFQTYLSSRKYSDAFLEQFLFPALASTLCTCSYSSLQRYPAKTVLRSMLQLVETSELFRVKHGSSDVAARLSSEISDVRLNSTVNRIRPDENCVRLRLNSGDEFVFDHLILATQANTAVRLLDEPSANERAALDSFSYDNVEVVLHRDSRLMPANRRDWANFNILTNRDRTDAMCTVWMNRFCQDWTLETDIFQTIRPIFEPAENRLICRRQLQRPIVDWRSIQGLEMLSELHQEVDRRIWFCGSYASPGVPLLESGVASSISVVERISDLVQRSVVTAKS